MNLAPEILDHNARTNRYLRRLAVVVAVIFLALNAITAAAVLRVAVLGAEESAIAASQSQFNARLLEIILADTGCLVDDTPAQCSQRVRDANRAEGARRIIEVDCAARRLAAGLPAPIPPDSCPEQTPSEVYPGGQAPTE